MKVSSWRMSTLVLANLAALFLAWQYRVDCWRFRRQRADYFEYLHALLSGLHFRRTLADVFLADSRRYQNKHWRGRLSTLWLQTYQHSGGDLYAVWQDCLPGDELMLIRSAHSAGKLESGLQALSEYLDVLLKHQRVFWSVLWPALIGIWVPVCLLAAIPLYTVPALQVVFQDLPTDYYAAHTQHLFFLAGFLRTYAPLLGLCCVLLGMVLYHAFWGRSHLVRRLLDQWSIFQLLRLLAALRFFSLLGVLLRPAAYRQLSLRTALENIVQGAGPWMHWHVAYMLKRIEQGVVGAHTLNTGLLNPEDYWFFGDMAQVQSLDQAAWRTAQRLSLRLSVQGARLAVRWRWLILGACVLITLGMGLWHYLVIDELRQSLSLFYAGV